MPGLLDVNLLLALLLENHDFHRNAMLWFAGNQKFGWATCPITELGFARTASNPGYLRPPAKISAALELLSITTEASSTHIFWPGSLRTSAIESAVAARLTGHKQLTDAYLLSLAIHNRGKLVTFDRRILQLAPEGSTERAYLEVLA